MKHLKKLFAVAVALFMAIAVVTPALADGNNGVINISNAQIGKEYKAYKILDATYDGDAIAYTTDEAHKAVFQGENSPFTVANTADSEGNYNVQSTANAATINAWIASNLGSFTAVPTSKASGVDENNVAIETTVEWSGLEYGYYYITTGIGADVTVTSVKPTANVIDKNDNEPHEDPEDPEGVKTNYSPTAQIGDTVDFRVTFIATNFYVPENATTQAETTPITEYYVNDVPDGYDIVADTLVVTVNGNEVTDTITNAAINNQTGALTFTIPWVDAKGDALYADSAKVIITYSGTVNATAADGDAENTVNVTNDSEHGAITGSSTTTTLELTVKKVDGADTTKELDGAKFLLFRQTEDGLVAVPVVNVEGNTYRVAVDGEEGVEIEAGTAIITGLDGDDTYELQETQAPSGYNKLSTNFVHVMEEGDNVAQVENNAGATLPSTGGIGTTLFYVIGGILVAGAAIALVVKNRVAKIEE